MNHDLLCFKTNAGRKVNNNCRITPGRHNIGGVERLPATHGSLGEICFLQNKLQMLNIPPEPLEYAVALFAGDNGVSREGVSSYEPLSSWIIAGNHLAGLSFTSRLMQRLAQEEWVIDVGLTRDLPCDSEWLISDLKVVRGTGNILLGPALSREQVLKSLIAGEVTIDTLVKKGKRAIGLGEIGVANTLAAYTMVCVLLGLPPSLVVGWGSDTSGHLFAERLDLLRRIVSRIADLPWDVMRMLEEVGSSEIVAMSGAILCANRLNIPVMLDGFVSAVAALVACRFNEKCARILIAPTSTRERAHFWVLNELGLSPLFNLKLGYGEGIAAGLGLFLLEIANDFRFLQDLECYKEN